MLDHFNRHPEELLAEVLGIDTIKPERHGGYPKGTAGTCVLALSQALLLVEELELNRLLWKVLAVNRVSLKATPNGSGKGGRHAKGLKVMQKFVVTTTQEIQADSAEEAALLMFQNLVREPTPVSYLVADEKQRTVDVLLDRTQANEFAAIDHTADPGNW